MIFSFLALLSVVCFLSLAFLAVWYQLWLRDICLLLFVFTQLCCLSLVLALVCWLCASELDTHSFAFTALLSWPSCPALCYQLCLLTCHFSIMCLKLCSLSLVSPALFAWCCCLSFVFLAVFSYLGFLKVFSQVCLLSCAFPFACSWQVVVALISEHRALSVAVIAEFAQLCVCLLCLLSFVVLAARSQIFFLRCVYVAPFIWLHSLNSFSSLCSLNFAWPWLCVPSCVVLAVFSQLRWLSIVFAACPCVA